MKGGFNNPPNNIVKFRVSGYVIPSMKGGFNNPPNNGCRSSSGFVVHLQ